MFDAHVKIDPKNSVKISYPYVVKRIAGIILPGIKRVGINNDGSITGASQ